MGEPNLVEVRDLRKYFAIRHGIFRFGAPRAWVRAVDGVNFSLAPGEILGLVGESGCGKTTTGRLITRLEDPSSGNIVFEDRDIAGLSRNELKTYRKNVSMIFQDPYESLNPGFTVAQSVREPLVVHGMGSSYQERQELVVRALEDAGLVPGLEYLERYPHQLSGGQRQRVAIARALVAQPKFIVADEPVSMLDVSIRAGVLNLMLDLRDKYHVPYLFITHDIAVARYMSDRLAVMYLGRVVETGPAEQIIENPGHPYTIALLAAAPVPDPAFRHGQVGIKGEIPSPINLPTGCRFHPRCVYAKEICRQQEPPLIEVDPGHLVECHFAREIADGEMAPGGGLTIPEAPAAAARVLGRGDEAAGMAMG